jgi:hypothetical protein
MSEIELHHQQTELATIAAPLTNGTDLTAWVADLESAFNLAQKFCATPFAPPTFKGKPVDAAVAILYGKALKLDPLTSLQAVFVIGGRPGTYSKFMHAVVLNAGHEVWVESESETEVVVKGRRKGSENITTSTWTIARARKAGYMSNKKYETDPQSMLKARAIGDVCRVVAPDALAGLAYNEADVAVMEPVEEVPAASKPRATRQRKPVEPVPVPDVVLEEVIEQEPYVLEQEPEPDPITPAQLTKLNIVLQEQGLTERGDKLNYLSTYLERPIESSKDLTKAEAHRLIDEHEIPAAS